MSICKCTGTAAQQQSQQGPCVSNNPEPQASVTRHFTQVDHIKSIQLGGAQGRPAKLRTLAVVNTY